MVFKSVGSKKGALLIIASYLFSLSISAQKFSSSCECLYSSKVAKADFIRTKDSIVFQLSKNCGYVVAYGVNASNIQDLIFLARYQNSYSLYSFDFKTSNLKKVQKDDISRLDSLTNEVVNRSPEIVNILKKSWAVGYGHSYAYFFSVFQSESFILNFEICNYKLEDDANHLQKELLYALWHEIYSLIGR